MEERKGWYGGKGRKVKKRREGREWQWEGEWQGSIKREVTERDRGEIGMGGR